MGLEDLKPVSVVPGLQSPRLSKNLGEVSGCPSIAGSALINNYHGLNRETEYLLVSTRLQI